MIKLSNLSEGVTKLNTTYICRVAETDTHLKMVVDQECNYTDANGIYVTEHRSDLREIVVFNKETQEWSNRDTLLILGSIHQGSYQRQEEYQKSVEEFLALLPDEDDSTNRSFSAGRALAHFMHRYVYLTHYHLFVVGGAVMERASSKLVYYLDHLDNIEKMCLTISPETVASQINNNTLQFFDGGKKLKSIIGLPLEIVTALDEYSAGQTIHYFQNYVRDGGSVEDIRKMFAFLEACKKINRKRKICYSIDISSMTISHIAHLLDKGCKMTSILDGLSRELLMFQYGDDFDINYTLRNMNDTMDMLIKMGNPTRHFEQNIKKWHWTVARNYKILQDSRSEEYALAAQKLNQKSRIVDGYLIKCPETDRELFDIGVRYNNCLPLYINKVIDDNAIIYSMYPVDADGEIIDTMPPVTFEVTPTLDFVQIKTFNDVDVYDEEILSVVKKWKTKIRKENSNGNT